VELYLHSPNTPSWHGAQLKYRDRFIFTYLLLVPVLLPMLKEFALKLWIMSRDFKRFTKHVTLIQGAAEKRAIIKP
jgi:hypothetical protein